MPAIAPAYAEGPMRVQFQRKDPQGWREMADALARHSTTGSALTLCGVQGRRRGTTIAQPCPNALGNEP